MPTSLDAMMSELSAAIAGAPPGLQAANQLCVVSAELFEVDGAAVSMIHDGASRGTFGSSGEHSRRLDEYQFTFGEGPCLDAVAARETILVPDLDSANESRWPAFAGAVLGDGIRGVFALPIMIASVCVGALDLFREGPGPLQGDQLTGALLAAELASLPLLDLLTTLTPDAEETPGEGEAWAQLADLDRIEVYQATGVLISQLDVGAAEALVRLRGHAIATGHTASQVAFAILDGNLRLERDHPGGTGRGHP